MFKPLDPLLHSELRLAVMSADGSHGGQPECADRQTLGSGLHRGGEDF